MKFTKKDIKTEIIQRLGVEEVPVLEPSYGYAIFPSFVELTWQRWSDSEPEPYWALTADVRGPRRLQSGRPSEYNTENIRFFGNPTELAWASNVTIVPAWLTELVKQVRPEQTKEA